MPIGIKIFHVNVEKIPKINDWLKGKRVIGQHYDRDEKNRLYVAFQYIW